MVYLDGEVEDLMQEHRVKELLEAMSRVCAQWSSASRLQGDHPSVAKTYRKVSVQLRALSRRVSV